MPGAFQPPLEYELREVVISAYLHAPSEARLAFDESCARALTMFDSSINILLSSNLEDDSDSGPREPDAARRSVQPVQQNTVRAARHAGNYSGTVHIRPRDQAVESATADAAGVSVDVLMPKNAATPFASSRRCRRFFPTTWSMR